MSLGLTLNNQPHFPRLPGEPIGPELFQLEKNGYSRLRGYQPKPFIYLNFKRCLFFSASRAQKEANTLTSVLFGLDTLITLSSQALESVLYQPVKPVLMDRGRLELPMYLTWVIYSHLPSPLGYLSALNLL